VEAVARAHPSLALIKYWGKENGGVNLPATSSLAVTLGELTTETRCSVAPDAAGDSLTIDGVPQEMTKVSPFLDRVRSWIEASGTGSSNAGDPSRPIRFNAESSNSFPTAAGLASSASGFAALTLAAVAAAGGATDDRSAISALAREGSGSAARSVFGGFTVWEAGEPAARELLPPDWWPELRVVVLPLATGPKGVSSRDGMNRTRDTSPFYAAWVADAPSLFARGEAALMTRDLQQLGEAMRLSYLRMFGTMISAEPPILYWIPETMAVLHQLQRLRAAGIPAWETMDAGPQVKVVTTAAYAGRVVEETSGWCARDPIISSVGPAARLIGA
jgi:diphosphomevalonate decarboxylase